MWKQEATASRIESIVTFIAMQLSCATRRRFLYRRCYHCIDSKSNLCVSFIVVFFVMGTSTKAALVKRKLRSSSTRKSKTLLQSHVSGKNDGVKKSTDPFYIKYYSGSLIRLYTFFAIYYRIWKIISFLNIYFCIAHCLLKILAGFA